MTAKINPKTELCPHGRHEGAVCLPCSEEATLPDKPDYVDPYDMQGDPHQSVDEVNSGLNANYYKLPRWVKDAQDLIEWLSLDFANGNIMKSLIRENNPEEQKHSDELYEAEKRYFFARRHLRRVQRAAHEEDCRTVEEMRGMSPLQSDWSKLRSDVEKELEALDRKVWGE